MKRVSVLVLAALLAGVSSKAVVHNVPFVIGFHPLHGAAQPYVGQLFLTFNNGIISGKYTDISVRPGSPLADQTNVRVTGSVSDDGTLRLIIRQLTFRGTMKDNWMSGDVNVRGGLYVFEAEQGKVAGF